MNVGLSLVLMLRGDDFYTFIAVFISIYWWIVCRRNVMEKKNYM